MVHDEDRQLANNGAPWNNLCSFEENPFTIKVSQLIAIAVAPDGACSQRTLRRNWSKFRQQKVVSSAMKPSLGLVLFILALN